MVKKVLSASTFVALLISCSSIKPLAFTNSKPASTSSGESKNQVKFLDISTDDNADKESKSTIKGERVANPKVIASTESDAGNYESTRSENSSGLAKASSLQLKYGELMNTDPGEVQNLALYKTIDDWYGTRYRLGGTSKSGIDCSAFVQTIFASVYGVSLPRMARDQYKATRRVSRTALQEGDLLFFNTRGGVSHVGIYLQNNKFVHASVSGVMISDMFEAYYVKHFISAGRVTGMTSSVSASVKSVRP